MGAKRPKSLVSYIDPLLSKHINLFEGTNLRTLYSPLTYIYTLSLFLEIHCIKLLYDGSKYLFVQILS